MNKFEHAFGRGVQVKKADEELGVPCAEGGYGPGGKGWGMLVSLDGEIRCIVGDDHHFRL